MPTCTGCQAENPARAKFCLECGVKMDAVPAPAPVTPERRTTPLADKIRQAKPSIEGERKQVTVLLAA